MRYVDEVLQPGETVRLVTTKSWVGYLPGLALLILAAVAYSWYAPIGLVILLVSAYLLVRAWWKRFTTEFAVTNRRVIYKTGFIGRRTVEIHMDKIASVDVRQSILGRLLNYGDLTVNGAGNNNIETISLIDRPLDFRNCVTATAS